MKVGWFGWMMAKGFWATAAKRTGAGGLLICY